MPTAQPKGRTRSTANATGTAHHANDGATAVSVPQSTTIPITQTVGHQVRSRRQTAGRVGESEHEGADQDGGAGGVEAVPVDVARRDR